MESKIVLIRHGITVGNEQHMYYGSTDVSLSERGMHLLEKQRDEGVYPVSEDAQFFTTGMLRTEQSLEIIYGEREHEVIEALRELDFGEFEMCTYEQLNSVPEYQQWIRNHPDKGLIDYSQAPLAILTPKNNSLFFYSSL